MKARTMRCHVCSATRTTRDQQAFCSGNEQGTHLKTRMMPVSSVRHADRVLGEQAIQSQRLGLAKF